MRPVPRPRPSSPPPRDPRSIAGRTARITARTTAAASADAAAAVVCTDQPTTPFAGADGPRSLLPSSALRRNAEGGIHHPAFAHLNRAEDSAGAPANLISTLLRLRHRRRCPAMPPHRRHAKPPRSRVAACVVVSQGTLVRARRHGSTPLSSPPSSIRSDGCQVAPRNPATPGSVTSRVGGGVAARIGRTPTPAGST